MTNDTSSKHTPGPWFAAAACVYAPWPNHDGARMIADLLAPHGHNGVSNEEAEANAPLMAQAPNLLAALKAIVTQAQHIYAGAPSKAHSSQIIGLARAAIARVEGE